MREENYNDPSFDEGYETPPSNWVQWGKIGDVIKGTYVGSFERENPKNGLMVTNYEIMIEIGRFHPIKETKPDSGVYVAVEEPVMINPGEIYNVGGKKIIDNAMRNCKLGQKVLMRFIDTFKMPKGTAKTIEVKLGVMDTSYNAPENNGDTHLE